jgi:hypothetical protein
VAHRARSVLVIAVTLAGLEACTPFKDASGMRRSHQTQTDASTSPDAESLPASSDGSTADTDGGMAAPAKSGQPATGAKGAKGAAGSGGRDARLPSDSGGSDAHAGSGTGGAAGRGIAGSPVDDPPLSMVPVDPSVTVVPAETADLESLQLFSDWSKLPVFATGQYDQQSSADRSATTGPQAQLFPVLRDGNRDFGNFLCKSADADVGSGALTGYQYDAASCPETYVRGAVLARFEGSGWMQRFWLTVDSLNGATSTLQNEMLRVYVDDNPAVAIQVPLVQVLNGMAGEMFTIPFGATSTSYIAWHYPIVFSRKLLVALDHLSSQYYYQVDAVLDAPPRRRVASRKRLDERDAAHALLVRASPVPSEAALLQTQQFALAPGAQQAVTLSGPATTQELRLRVAKAKLSSLADVRISVRWDAAAQPTIDVPLLELFAASRAVVSNNSLALSGTVEGDDQVLSLRLPMPYRTSAEWTLTNGSGAAVGFQLDWIGEPKVPSGAFGHLSVQVADAAIPPAQLEQTLADVTGRGRFIGVCVDLGGHHDPALVGVMTSSLDVLQGDFRATADGRRVIDSTGTEDYADSAFYFRDSPKASPFAQNWARVDDVSMKPSGQISFCRWQVLGSEVDFQRSFHAVHEVSQHDLSLIDLHHSLAFLYVE